jgi:ABC-type iron transport system FetAB permease component
MKLLRWSQIEIVNYICYIRHTIIGYLLRLLLSINHCLVLLLIVSILTILAIILLTILTRLSLVILSNLSLSNCLNTTWTLETFVITA